MKLDKLHHSKHPTPNSVIDDGIMTFDKDVHAEKQKSGIFVTDDGISIPDKE